MEKNKVLVIAGPTASGKSALAIRLAKRFAGEIISGDSIQIYRGLDIGSAKTTRDQQEGIPHYLIDIKDPKEHYSVMEFQKLGREYIEKITQAGKLPIVCGGTGLYIKALLYDYVFFAEEKADDQYPELTNQQLYDLLATKDPKALEKIHINNRKRLVRALNIVEKHDRGISAIKDAQEHQPLYDILIIGIDVPRDVLNRRIEQRIDAMLEKGLLAEIRGLLESGITFDDQCMQAIGYKEFAPYFSRQSSLEACVEEAKKNTRRFAKRQMTWFRNQFKVHWLNDEEAISREVAQWLI